MVTPWMARGNALNYMKETPIVDKHNLVSKMKLLYGRHIYLTPTDKRHRKRTTLSSFLTTCRGTRRPPLCEFLIVVHFYPPPSR